MYQPPYEVEREEHTTLALMDPPGPPEYPAPPGYEPAGGRPGEGDRVWVHLVWELLLAVAVLGQFVLVRSADSGALSGGRLDQFIYQAAALGLVATGLAFSLRAAVPNLAVGAIASGAGVTIAKLTSDADWGLGLSIAVAVAGGLLAGLVLAAVVVIFHVPAWAASLGAALLIGAVSVGVADNGLTRITGDAPDIRTTGWIWFGFFVVVSTVGGAFWAAPGLRRRMGGTRQDRDPAERANAAAAAGAVIALVVSSTLAAGGGALIVLRLGAAQPTASDNLTWLALAAVLIGGVSVFGRRAGIFGTVLGVLLFSLIQLELAVESVESWVFTAIIGGGIVVGLIVSRLLEAAGRKR
jgi:ribose/xylose/arabinose/galactoside ABC-type transport system permease subunit